MQSSMNIFTGESASRAGAVACSVGFLLGMYEALGSIPSIAQNSVFVAHACNPRSHGMKAFTSEEHPWLH